MPPDLLHNEKDLLSRTAIGDAEAFRDLFRHYYGPVYSVAFRYIKVHDQAEDIVQQSFLKIWEKRHILSSVVRFDAYLFRIARNEIVSQFRKQAVHNRYLQHIRELFKEEQNSPEDQLIARQRRTAVQELLRKLSPQQQLAYRLSRDQGLPYEEIALAMGLSVSTVKGHITAALRNIRELAGSRRGELCLLLSTCFLGMI
ncbi:MAG TPA: RNA polymerase sigma-70 factor [Puia sp.]|nr:RNA polymerase sigma-70 factor [Puia sp.]